MIAYLGLGLLGSNFVRAMVRRGEQVHVWNRSPEKARALASEGAKPFAKVEDAVRGATRVHLTLSDDAAVDDVLSRALPALTPDSFVVDHTTTSPAGTTARAARFDAAKIPFIHAPVFMGPPNALDASGIMLAAGPQDRFDRIRPELEKMTGKVIYLGADPKRAAVFKLMGNMLLIEFMAGVADLFSLGKAEGIAPADAATLLDFFNPAVLVASRAKRMLDAKFDDASFTLEMARKDVRLMLESAERGGTHLIELPGVAKEMDRWLSQGAAKKDWTIIAKDATKSL